MLNKSISHNGTCHKVVSLDEARRIQREHWQALDAAGKPGSVERCQVMNQRVRESGLIRAGYDEALLVHIGGEHNHRYCDVCDGGEWPARPSHESVKRSWPADGPLTREERFELDEMRRAEAGETWKTYAGVGS